eukprot:TRINITY_DN2076_c0_g1_i1.p1 TRINITY_DN2076_c0_g1~~TRINITY_DN2076_c0_g1_i1.p1  ORF type:complete len:1104 (+),score=204.80 TRINITY_DN2076_c0_g1_i1:621-3932(+)
MRPLVFSFLILTLFLSVTCSLEIRPVISSVQFSKEDYSITILGSNFGSYSEVFINETLNCSNLNGFYSDTFHRCTPAFPLYRDLYYNVVIRVNGTKSIPFTFVAESTKIVRVGPGNADAGISSMDAINMDPNWKVTGVCTYAGEIISQVRLVYVHNNGSKIYSSPKTGWQDGGDGCTEIPLFATGVTSVQTWYTTHPYYGTTTFCGFQLNYVDGSAYGQYFRCAATDARYVVGPFTYPANPESRIIGLIGDFWNSGKIGFYTTAAPTLIPFPVAPSTQPPATSAPVNRPIILDVAYSEDDSSITIRGSNFGTTSSDFSVLLNGNTLVCATTIFSTTWFRCNLSKPLQYRDYYYEVVVQNKEQKSFPSTFVIGLPNFVRVGPGNVDSPIDYRDVILPNKDPNWKVTGLCTYSGEIIDAVRLIFVNNNGSRIYSSYPSRAGFQEGGWDGCIERPIPERGLMSVETWYTTHPYYGGSALCGLRLNYVNGSSYGLYYGCSRAPGYVVGPVTYQANPAGRIVGMIAEFWTTGKFGFYVLNPTLISNLTTNAPATQLPTNTPASQFPTNAPTTQFPNTSVPFSPTILNVRYIKESSFISVRGLNFGPSPNLTVFYNRNALVCLDRTVSYSQYWIECVLSAPLLYRDYYYDVVVQSNEQKSVPFTFVLEPSNYTRVGPGIVGSPIDYRDVIVPSPNWKVTGLCTDSGEIIDQIRLIFVHNNGSKTYSSPKAGWQNGGNECIDRPIPETGLKSVETWYTTHPYYGGSALCGLRLNYVNGSSYGLYYGCSRTDARYVVGPVTYQANPAGRIVGMIAEFWTSGRFGFYTTGTPTLLFETTLAPTQAPTTKIPAVPNSTTPSPSNISSASPSLQPTLPTYPPNNPTTAAPTQLTTTATVSSSQSLAPSSSRPRYTTNTSPLSATISCVGRIQLEEAIYAFRNLELKRFGGDYIFQVNGVEFVVIETKREVTITKIFVTVTGDYPITSLGVFEDISKKDPASFELSILDIQVSSRSFSSSPSPTPTSSSRSSRSLPIPSTSDYGSSTEDSETRSERSVLNQVEDSSSSRTSTSNDNTSKENNTAGLVDRTAISGSPKVGLISTLFSIFLLSVFVL